MLALNADSWVELRHAYGPASNIPALLEQARTETRRGHISGTPWFMLWSALCHRGHTYTASFAATPHLISMASACLERHIYDPLYLAAMIELSRLEGHGPSVPAYLAADHESAVRAGVLLAEQAARSPWNMDAAMVLEASLRALRGDVAGAHEILDADAGDSAPSE